MKTASQIRFDFHNAVCQADELEEVAQRLISLANKDLGEIVENLPSYWEGPSARLFQSKASEMKGDLLQTAKSLRGEAQTIRAIARKIYDAEMAALELARRRAKEAAAAAKKRLTTP